MTLSSSLFIPAFRSSLSFALQTTLKTAISAAKDRRNIGGSYVFNAPAENRSSWLICLPINGVAKLVNASYSNMQATVYAE